MSTSQNPPRKKVLLSKEEWMKRLPLVTEEGAEWLAKQPVDPLRPLPENLPDEDHDNPPI